MKIIIKDESTNLKLYLPLSLIKSQLIMSCILKKASKELQDFIKSAMPFIYKELKRYKKENGRIDLINISSANGDVVRVII